MAGKKLQIAFLPGSPPVFGQGGIEVQAEQTKVFLERLGHKVYWVNFGDRSLLQKADIFHMFGTGWHLYPWAQFIKMHNKNLIISPVFYTESLLKRVLYRIVVYAPQTFPRVRKLLLHSADFLLPNSRAEAEQISKLFGICQEKMLVVPNGIETDFMGENPLNFRKKYLPDLNETTPFVLSVHRIESRKNTLNLVRAAILLNVPLVLIGGVNRLRENRKFVAEVMHLVEKHSPLIRYLGLLPREELKDAYAAAHVHAMPSYMETPGLTSLEAGLNGCNLVVGYCPPVLEYFSGIAFIQKHDATSIAKGIEIALRSPRNCFSQAEKIRKSYSWERVAELTEKAYLQVLKQKEVSPDFKNIAAVIVTHNPDKDLKRRLNLVTSQAAYVIIVDNGSINASEIIQLKGPKVEIIANKNNPGLATALNQGMKRAEELNFRWVLTLDQDTLIDDNMIDSLINIYHQYPHKEKIGVIGSNARSKISGRPFRFCRHTKKDFIKIKTAITAGSLMPLSVYEKVGPFRDKFFIEGIDLEYCLRLRKYGYEILFFCRPLMTHAAGKMEEYNFLGRVILVANNEPWRYYLAVRNLLEIFMIYFWREPIWVLGASFNFMKTVIKIILYEDAKMLKLEYLNKGIWDALFGRRTPLNDL